MDRQQVKVLLRKYNQGLATTEESAWLENWYVQKSDSLSLADDEIDFKRIEENLRTCTLNYAGLNDPDVKTKGFKLWPRIVAAASVLLVAGAGIYFYSNVISNLPQDNNTILGLSKLDIPPGRNKATLTFANGSVINLSDAKTGVVIDAAQLTYNDGTEIRDPSLRGDDVAINISARHPELLSGSRTITTPRGGTYQVILPDGTHIWLNAASSIKFPSTFAGLKERKVELTGEAYFVVKHNAKQPFRVETQGQIVEDIGTEFNINAYTGESNVKTTLIEGSARIIVLSSLREKTTKQTDKQIALENSHNDIILKPNQQSILTQNDIKIQNVDPEEAIAWKNGEIILNGQDVQSIMRMISRWYDVEIVYEGEISKELYYAKISRFDNIGRLLKQLEKAQGIHFKIEGRKVIVTK